MAKPVQKALMQLILSLLAFSSFASNAPQFPIQVSPNGRYLVDQRGAPFFYNAETAWRLFTNLSKEDAVELMKIRKAQGFNVIQVSMLDNPQQSLKNYYGDEPFTQYTDLSTPSDPYFDHAYWVVKEAEKMGLVIAITAVWKGCCGEDWAQPLTENGPKKASVFGDYLGRKFHDLQNVMWILGGDNDPGCHLDHYREMAVNIEKHSPHQIQTFHAASSHSSSDVLPYSSQGWLDFSMTYTYYAGKDVWLTLLERGEMLEVYEVNHIEYFKRPVRPFLLGESQYEGDGAPQNPDGLDFPAVVRRQAYWSVLGGGCGHAYGSWNWKVTPEWRKVKDMPGALQMGYFRAFFEDRKWFELVPDIHGKIISTGVGEYGKTDYIVAAQTPDKLSTVVYLPPSKEDVRKFDVLIGNRSGSFKARWFDPTNNQYLAAKEGLLPGTALHSFTSPGKNSAGSNDWILVIEAIEHHYPAPKASKTPKVDGKADRVWESAPWATIEHEWLEKPAEVTVQDFSGRFKALWTENKLFLLLEIQDDKLVDDIADPLVDYWEDDLLEVFIDEDHSGGDHKTNYNAFAYHISAKEGRVVDWGTEGKPLFFDDHVEVEIKKEGDTYTWELAIDIYTDQFVYGQSNEKVKLLPGKVMGFSIAYCDDDGKGRENFIATVPNGLDSWMDASLFGKIELIK